MMPAELLSGAVPVRPDPGPKASGLGDQLRAIHEVQVVVHDAPVRYFVRTAWPPNSLRSAAITFAPKDSS